jgi:hypothetical protein
MYAAVVLFFLAVTLVAAYLPARRATGLEPAVALRCELEVQGSGFVSSAAALQGLNPVSRNHPVGPRHPATQRHRPQR